MCGCKDCKGLTLLKGTGIVSTVDNLDGTFTINYSDGTSFTTSDFTGPTGAVGPAGPAGVAGPAGANGAAGSAGADGADGTTLIDHTYGMAAAPISLTAITLTSADFIVDEDGIEYTFILKTEGATTGNLRILLNASVLVDRVLVAAKTTNLVTVRLFRATNDLTGHITITPVEDGMDNGYLNTSITEAACLLNVTNTITAQLTGTNAQIGLSSCVKILK